MNGLSSNASFLEIFDDLVCTMLRPSEYQHTVDSAVFQNISEKMLLIFTINEIDALIDSIGSARNRRNFDLDRLSQDSP